jgi:hypothetical protein
VTFAGLAQPHAGAAAKETRVVLGLGQGTVLTRRGHLQRVALTVLGQVPRDALAEVEAHAVGVIDEQPQGGTCHLGQQHLYLGLDAGKSGFDLGL